MRRLQILPKITAALSRRCRSIPLYLHDAVQVRGAPGKNRWAFPPRGFSFRASGYDARAVIAGRRTRRTLISPSRAPKRADFRLCAALRAQPLSCRRKPGVHTRRPISRHPPRADRKPLRTSFVRYGCLFRVDRMLRRLEQFGVCRAAKRTRSVRFLKALKSSGRRRRPMVRAGAYNPIRGPTGVAGLHLLRAATSAAPVRAVTAAGHSTVYGKSAFPVGTPYANSQSL